jgi:hypothetical protein
MSNRPSERPAQLTAVLNGKWVSSVELRRLLGWRNREGEPLNIPAFALALSRACAPLIESGLCEIKRERGTAGRPMRYLRCRIREKENAA